MAVLFTPLQCFNGVEEHMLVQCKSEPALTRSFIKKVRFKPKFRDFGLKLKDGFIEKELDSGGSLSYVQRL